MIKSKKKQVHRTILQYLMDLNILCIIISKQSSKLFETLKQFPIPNSEILKQSIGEGTEKLENRWAYLTLFDDKRREEE